MKRLVLGVIFLGAALALPAQQPKEETVIQPRGTAQAGSAGASPAAGSLNSSFLLTVAILAGAGGWWFWLKRKETSRFGGKAGHLTIAESRSLGSRQYLVVADYNGRKFLLGVCPGSIELLTPLDGEAPKSSPES